MDRIVEKVTSKVGFFHHVTALFNGLFAGRRSGAVASGRRNARLNLEPLECRLAPATLHWTGLGANNNMSLAANYLENPVNGVLAGDTIIFNPCFGSKNAVADPGFPANFGALQFDPGFPGSLTVARDLAVNSLITNGQFVTIDANCTLAVHAGLWMGINLAGEGEFKVFGAAGDQGAITSMVPSTIEVESMSIDANSQFGISADTTFPIGTEIENQGVLTWLTGTITANPDLNLTNDTSGTFAIWTGGESLTGFPEILNKGRIVVSAGGPENPVVVSATLQNISTVANPFEIQNGMLRFRGELDTSAPIKIDSGAFLKQEAGVGIVASPGARFDGAGMLLLAGDLTVPASMTLQVDPAVQMVEFGFIGGGGEVAANSGLASNGGTIQDTLVTVTMSVFLYETQRVDTALTLNGARLVMITGGTWDSGFIDMNASVIQNWGTFDLQANSTMRDPKHTSLLENFEVALSACIEVAGGQ